MTKHTIEYYEDLFIEAIANGNYADAEVLLNKGVNPDITPSIRHLTSKHTPLVSCIFANKPQQTESLIRALVAHGADINQLRNGLTLLSMCAVRGGSENAKLLIELGASLNLGLTDGDDALKQAKLFKSHEIVSLINFEILNKTAHEDISFSDREKNKTNREEIKSSSLPKSRARI